VLRALDTLKRGMRHLHDAIAESIRLFSALAVPACTVTPRAQVRSPPEHVRTPFVFATLSPLWRQRDLGRMASLEE